MGQLADLKAELVAGHPGTGPYNVDHALAADELNAVNRTRNRASMSGDEIFQATDGTQWDALTDAQKTQWLSLCGRDQLDPFAAANVKVVTSIFGGGTATVIALQAARVENISRAEELGLGRVLPGTVAQARAL